MASFIRPLCILFLFASHTLATPNPHHRSARQVMTKDDFPFKDPPITSPNPTTPTGTLYRTDAPSRVNNQALKPGDAIVFLCGTYRNAVMRVKSSGTTSAPVIIKAEKVGCVTFTGDSYFTVGGNYVEIQGFVFKGSKKFTDPAVTFERGTKGGRFILNKIDGHVPTVTTKASCVILYGTGHRIDWNTFVNINHEGEMVRVMGPNLNSVDSSNHYIGYNYFGPRRLLSGADNGGEVVQMGTLNNDKDVLTTVEFNVFEKITSDPEIVSTKSSSNTIQYNSVYGGSGMFAIRAGNRNVMRGNYFFCSKQANCGGVRVYRQDNTLVDNYVDSDLSQSGTHGSFVIQGARSVSGSKSNAAQRTLVHNNLAVYCKYCLTFGNSNGGDLGVTDTVVRNNTFIGSTASDWLIKIYDKGEKNTRFADNVFWRGKIPTNRQSLVSKSSIMITKLENGVSIPNVPKSNLPSFTYRPLKPSEVGAGVAVKSGASSSTTRTTTTSSVVDAVTKVTTRTTSTRRTTTTRKATATVGKDEPEPTATYEA